MKTDYEISRPDLVILELRKKLEIRTWFLRTSLAFNIGIIAGLVVKYLP